MHPADIPNVLLQHQPAHVVFEDSRLQSHVWGRGTGVAAAAKVARNVGEVDAWCRLIEHTCSKLGIKRTFPAQRRGHQACGLNYLKASDV